MDLANHYELRPIWGPITFIVVHYLAIRGHKCLQHNCVTFCWEKGVETVEAADFSSNWSHGNSKTFYIATIHFPYAKNFIVYASWIKSPYPVLPENQISTQYWQKTFLFSFSRSSPSAKGLLYLFHLGKNMLWLQWTFTLLILLYVEKLERGWLGVLKNSTKCTRSALKFYDCCKGKCKWQ